MAPLKRLRKASDKSTEATIVTEAATTKKRSREVEESSNALQTANLGYSSVKYAEASTHLAKGCPLIIYGIPLGQIYAAFWRGCPLLYLGYPPTKYLRHRQLARFPRRIIQGAGILLICGHIQLQVALKVI
ncbi:hypothetical protein FNV43_RR11085 [Rhamnella rubrinervis]|uniref:Uncharacterized protein n=1 Tax=Rhamnella rubrinervis TaxID=2594499 RepID=A0A8K0H5B5_9ROSA|nr:hypothetical protein FNV43_RR11085 [Rhamnella rubrinervis]